ncbi:MAG: DUF3368 domain-containing protein [Candidatus Electrothrix aestuarii]|uniref:DUF3368 domain-containing protein n=1 Tax=Candidatus Electrothrix aestuarii TaxID=3062594 RepID=A0AAU8LY11_9BACT|nr:hypothetical protein [Candidatus Electrothrix aestuarii]
MSKIVIADSSCLIGLCKINKLFVLEKIFENILIPEAVYHEVVIKGKGRQGAEEVKNSDWIEQRKIMNTLAVKALRIGLGPGESEAIILADECKADFLILDDLKARQTAEELGLTVVGTVALLKKAWEKDLIESFEDTLTDLSNVGFRFSVS